MGCSLCFLSLCNDHSLSVFCAPLLLPCTKTMSHFQPPKFSNRGEARLRESSPLMQVSQSMLALFLGSARVSAGAFLLPPIPTDALLRVQQSVQSRLPYRARLLGRS